MDRHEDGEREEGKGEKEPQRKGSSSYMDQSVFLELAHGLLA